LKSGTPDYEARLLTMRLQLSMKCCELVTGNRMREEASTQEETENKMKCTLENIMYTYESK
jgi:hypothetical protein